ncbi:hypothetical protein SELMODRAFT_105894 [Selaginella moellendorffii]|uniref:Laccase n=1 Tax=Selaginella moellendorffii TaxID=88036 RepID=D8S0U4_SELML|nr:laccase-13 [Selaginella moellendorffii]EFJ21994.1 hypothetical protein SELMODRAFT_105894 [Selaginella moellendorffii]|eukprot:XP_002976884.1 laccase-13 [Selaginella moellendorffii]
MQIHTRILVVAIGLLVAAGVSSAADSTTSTTRVYNFTIRSTNVRRLCNSKSLVAVNGRYPGPVIFANQGDRLLINVTNNGPYNITMHWHGIRQLFSCWADGPAYVTQCPIQPGGSYLYNYTIVRQSGTLFYHAHETWLRATVHGAMVVFPTSGEPYPFVFPKEEHIIILGEWWNANVEDVETQALLTGGGPALSDAYTINGLPGPLYNCSANDVYKLRVQPNKVYLLRIINAALNIELFFSVANHNITVVETDGDYTKPYSTTSIMITPGQTTNVLLTTDQPVGRYYMGASPYMSAMNVPFRMTPTLAILEYAGSNASSTPVMPNFPQSNDTAFVTTFSTSLRSLANAQHPEPVPQTITSNFFLTVGLGAKPCDANFGCQGPNGSKFTASVSNISFVLPSVSVLQAYFFNISNVFSPDFPAQPLNVFDYTGNPPSNITPLRGTRAAVIPFNASVQMVLQDTSILGVENHPIHLHGFSFYIVGQGFGNFNNSAAAAFNLVDPPRRNTVAVPVGGWAAIRFWADNPGVWYMHCHLEIHTSWGLATTFIVQNGPGNQTLPPPPPDLPQC